MKRPTEPSVEIDPPDIARHADGTDGVPYVHILDSGVPGPVAMISGVVHGNELCGAVVVNDLLNAGFHPQRGTLLLAFMNVDAYQRFDARDPGASRYVDEDFNRVWDAPCLDGPRQTAELRRARTVRPYLDRLDYLLDLHSTSSFSGPMILTGLTPRSMALGLALGAPPTLVRDAGHKAGRRMRDYGPFSDPDAYPTALLVECGQHWQAQTVTRARDVARRFIAWLDMGDVFSDTPRDDAPQTVYDVTEAVTVETEGFRFVEDFQGLEVIPRAGTVIAYDGVRPVATPYDACCLIMPTHGSRPGQTAVRLAREVQAA